MRTYTFFLKKQAFASTLIPLYLLNFSVSLNSNIEDELHQDISYYKIRTACS
jgi:hypothetical protein